ncbi:HAD family hydrolase, partial [Paenibacillus glucanolyticus]|uniref:HAD family hydrolase n=1 Tax=Paenibacillus glucanolyticus TaxID=59843 RepID=UPI003CFFDB36
GYIHALAIARAENIAASDLARYAHNFIRIMPDGLQLWSSHMGIDLENTVVFGDHINDVGLFEAGGTRIAVRNAHESIQRLADHIIDSNELDGVARYIQQQMEMSITETIL